MLRNMDPELFERQANKRREAMMSQPELFMHRPMTSAPMPSAALHPHSYQAVSEAHAAAPTATTPGFGAHAVVQCQVQGENSGALAWEQILVPAMQRAVSEGLTQGGKVLGNSSAEAAGLWHCPHCEIDVHLYHLDSHMTSKNHMKYREAKRYTQMMQQRQQQGDIPEWMEIRDGAEFCTLCWNYATEGHIQSSKHQKRLYYLSSRVEGAQPLNTAAAAPSAMAGAAAAPQGRPPPLPASWGHPDFYEWKPETETYFCKLCYKNADESHVYSTRHQNRAQHPEQFLCGTVAGDFVDVSMFGAPPPPPPPSGQPPTANRVDPWASQQQCQPCNPPWPAVNREVLAIEAPVEASVEASVDPWRAELIDPPAPPLPQQPVAPRWQRHHDENSGRHFYYSLETGVSEWELPDGESYFLNV